jgi:hypothetical protein
VGSTKYIISTQQLTSTGDHVRIAIKTVVRLFVKFTMIYNMSYFAYVHTFIFLVLRTKKLTFDDDDLRNKIKNKVIVKILPNLNSNIITTYTTILVSAFLETEFNKLVRLISSSFKKTMGRPSKRAVHNRSNVQSINRKNQLKQ